MPTCCALCVHEGCLVPVLAPVPWGLTGLVLVLVRADTETAQAQARKHVQDVEARCFANVMAAQRDADKRVLQIQTRAAAEAEAAQLVQLPPAWPCAATRRKRRTAALTRRVRASIESRAVQFSFAHARAMEATRATCKRPPSSPPLASLASCRLPPAACYTCLQRVA